MFYIESTTKERTFGIVGIMDVGVGEKLTEI